MKLSGLHFLLTYQCTFQCDHCFVWGSPRQSGTMSLEAIRLFLEQAAETGTITSVYFEGGEPFLYYPVMLAGVRAAREMGFRVGVVTNGYWATTLEDALTWLEPLADVLEDLSVSSDLYHYSEAVSRQARYAQEAAERLGLSVGFISVAQPEREDVAPARGQLPSQAGVMFRGRAAVELAHRVEPHAWETFDHCPYEDLRDPGRVHLDPLGYVHLCQGITLGNLFHTPLRALCEAYEPQAHPIVGPLLAGGPTELTQRYGLPHEAQYADACHLCYRSREALRPRFPEALGPDQMYGVTLD